MIARDLMNSDFPYVTVDADLAYVAKLLADCGLGAVPVVDDQMTPIGIVTRSNLENGGKADVSVDLGDIPAFLLRGRATPAFRPDGRALRDVMTTPAIYVPDVAQIPDVVRVMENHHLKRMPVVEGHKIVGLVLRKEVLGALSDTTAALAAHRRRPIVALRQNVETDRCAVATAAEFRELVATHERQEEQQRAEQARVVQEIREQRIRELAALRLNDAAWRDMLDQARRNAAAGLTESMLFRFPSQLCTDGGRAINAPDSRWPETLRGEPADIFRRWRNELQPRGFRIAAQIIDFPNGVPGDAALFLMWGAKN